MWIKPVVIILFVALVISLFSGLFFFVKDQGSSKRTYYSLGVRIGLTVLLFGFTAYGLWTGELGNTVPWDPSINGTK